MAQYLVAIHHPDDCYSSAIKTYSVCTDENPAKSGNRRPPVSIFYSTIVIKLLSAIRLNISGDSCGIPTRVVLFSCGNHTGGSDG